MVDARPGRNLLGLGLGEEHGVDVGEHAAAGDGDVAEQLVELLVVAHRELHVTRVDARLLVVARRVARELEDLRREVLKDRRHVDGGARAQTLRVVALLEVAAHTGDRELQAGARRLRVRLAAALSLSLSDLQRFFRNGLVWENTYPNFASSLDSAGHSASPGFNLACCESPPANCF